MGELARRSALDKQLIHYYLKKGYLHPPLYKQGNQALYDESHLEKLLFIKDCRKKGMPLGYSLELWNKERGGSRSHWRRGGIKGEGSHTRDRIIDKATNIFLKKGFRNTTISEIAESVGVTKASFYYYFENKKDLYFVCLDNIFFTVFVEALEEIKREKDPRKRWEMRWSATRAFLPEMITILQLIKESLGNEDEKHRLKAADLLRRSLIEPLQKDVERAIKGGVFRPVESEIVTFAIIAIFDIMAYRSMINSKYSDEDIQRSVLDLILHGLLASAEVTFNNPCQG
jgi:AcrR family transcriptional regulator